MLCIDHFYLDGIRLFHSMDIRTQFLVALVLERANMDGALYAMEEPWIAQFWYAEQVQGEKSFGSVNVF